MESLPEPRAEKDPAFLLKEIQHWNEKRDRQLQGLEYIERKIGELTNLLSSTNVIFVHDERWQQ